MPEDQTNLASIEPLDEKKFVAVLAGSKKPYIINEHSYPIGDLIHPLAYSVDVKNHPEMRAVPMGYRGSRNLKTLFDDLKRPGKP